ncbi:MAG: hypothetical protein U0361_06250 [Nitrospiraceae bacterium]
MVVPLDLHTPPILPSTRGPVVYSLALFPFGHDGVFRGHPPDRLAGRFTPDAAARVVQYLQATLGDSQTGMRDRVLVRCFKSTSSAISIRIPNALRASALAESRRSPN